MAHHKHGKTTRPHYMTYLIIALVGLSIVMIGALVNITSVSAQMSTQISTGSDHTDGFARYARVERPDGTYREMLIDQASLNAVRAGEALPDGATILMESYYSPNVIGNIFVKQRENGRWLYGSFGEGQPLPRVSRRPQCASCHRGAASTNGTYTLPMIESFAQAGQMKTIQCDKSGRAPCDADVYLIQ